MENFLIDGANVDQISGGSIDPLTLWPCEIFGPIGHNGNKKFTGADIKSLYLEKLCPATLYRHAKFRNDKTTFTNILADIFKTPLPPLTPRQRSY